MRLTDRELEELVQVRGDLDAFYDAIDRTNLQAKPVLQTLLIRDAGVLQRIFHRNRARVEIVLRRLGIEMPQDAPAELAAPAVQENAENVAPGKEEG